MGMDNATYALASKQIATYMNLDVIANNVANVNTDGFKADQMLFKQLMYKDANDRTSLPVGHTTATNFEEGPAKATGRMLDVAISGPGFFIVRTPLGDRYTRSGSLKVSRDGTLVTAQGYSVLSFDGQEIVFDEADSDPTIGEDGKVRVGTEERGEIGLVEFENTKLLKKLGNGLFMSSQDGTKATKSRIMQGVLEGSNVNAITQIARLAEMEKEVAQTSNLINETYNMQRNAFKIYARVGG